MNLVLIGMRGSGKSTVGRLAAERLNWHLVDTDEQVERSAGRSIPDIFAQLGEAEFRRLERAAVADACARDGCVISTGGGAVLDPANRGDMRRNGLIVWLSAPVELLAERIAADARTGAVRPTLLGGSPMQELEELLRRRRPIYEAAADLVLDVRARDPVDIAEELARLIESGGADGRRGS